MQALIAGSITAPPNDENAELGGYKVIGYELRTNADVGFAETNDDGEFVIGAAVLSGDAICAFRIVRQNDLVVDTGWNITWNAREYLAAIAQNQTPPLVEIPLQPTDAKVFGYVRAADGTPFEGNVALLRPQFTGDPDTVDSGTTAANGFYSLGPALPNEMLVVQASTTDQVPTVVATSPMHVGGGRIDLVVEDATLVGKSEFDDVSSKIASAVPNPVPEDFTVAQLAFLAAQTGLAPANLALFTRAAKLADENDLGHDFVYGLARVGHGLTLPEFLAGRDRFEDSLEDAVAQNIVTARDFATDLAHADELLRTRISASPAFAAAVASGGITSGQRTIIADALAANTGPVEDVWADLRANGAVGANAVAAAQDALRVDLVAIGHAPLIDDLMGDRGTAWATFRDLAVISQSDWETRIEALSSLPPEIPGQTTEARVAFYARSVRNAVAKAHPTMAVAAEAARSDTDYEDLAEFVAATPDYEMGVSTIRSFTADEDLIALGEPIERLFRVAPVTDRAIAVAALAAVGYDSAEKIFARGRAGLVSELTSSIGDAAAHQVYSLAAHVHNVSLALAFNYGADGGPPNDALIRRPPVPTALADWTALFGGFDFCACEHCQSVLSPAAYMVDVLQFLKQRPAGASPSAFARLDERRPDLQHIKLTCDNTNTPMPVIDLVNEILEQEVAPPATPDPPAPPGLNYGRQTTWSAADLLVHPEHVSSAAYEVLAGTTAKFPLGLPYDIWLDESRSYLSLLGVDRAALRTAFITSWDTDAEVAAERLNLGSQDVAILTNGDLTAADLWGVTNVSSLVHPSGALGGKIAVEPMLSRAEVSFDEFVALVGTDYVRGDTEAVVAFAGASCALSSAYVDLEETATDTDRDNLLRRLAQFARLRRRTQWSVLELDRALTFFQLEAAALSAGNVRSLAHAKLAAERLHLPIDEVLTCWADLDTRLEGGLPSQYERIYVDRRYAGPHPLRLDAARTELEVTTQPIVPLTSTTQPILPLIAAALRTSGQDIIALATATSLANATLASLSVLYRYVSLARALGLSVIALLDWIEITGRNPLTNLPTPGTPPTPQPATPEDLPKFIEEVRANLLDKVTADEIRYVLKVPPSPLDPSTASVTAFLSDLRSRLRAISATHAVSSATAENTEHYLRILYAPEVASAILSLASNLPDYSLASLDEAVRAAARTLIDTHFPRISATLSEAKNKLVERTHASFLETASERYAYLQPLLIAVHIREEHEVDVVAAVAAAAGLDPTVAKTILADVLHEVGTATTALASFTNVATIDDLEGSLADPAKLTYLRLKKLSLVVGRWTLGVEELPTLVTLFPFLDDLPVHASHADLAFSDWSHLREYASLRSWAGGRVIDVLAANIASTGTFPEALATLATRSKIAFEDLEFLAGDAGFNIDEAYPDAAFYGNLLLLSRASRAVEVVGLPASEVWPLRAWPTAFDSASFVARRRQAESIKAAARSRVSSTDALRRTRDGLRERQRDALLAYLRRTLVGALTDSAVLTGNVLIDVSTSSCAETSRIKQALSSIQLFIQRVSLQLELAPLVEFTEKDLEPWKWMKNYRVWEANRKVFLWPENWIEPELLGDKSPIFESVEEQLLQGELTPDAIEKAYLSYLGNLNEIAQLEICATCRQTTEDMEEDVTYVFGRTRTVPHKYFWRLRRGGLWSGWEKLEVDIEGNNLVAVFHNRRVHLFWTLIEEKPVPKGVTDSGPPEMYYQVKLAWTSYFAGAWSPKSISKVAMPVSKTGETIDKMQRVAPYYPFDPYWRKDSDPASILTVLPRVVAGDLAITVLRRLNLGLKSFDHFYEFAFRLLGCEGVVEFGKNPTNLELHIPKEADSYFQSFFNRDIDTGLTLPYRRPTSTKENPEPVLGLNPTPYRVHANFLKSTIWAAEPFLFQDEHRTFFVSRRSESERRPAGWGRLDGVHLDERHASDAWLDPRVEAPRAPVMSTIDPTPTMSTKKTGGRATLPAAAGLLAAMLGASGSEGDTVSMEEPSSALAEVTYHDEEGTVLSRFSAGSYGSNARIISSKVVVPSPTVLSTTELGAAERFMPIKAPHVSRYLFETFYHPYVCTTIEHLQRYGVPGLINPSPTSDTPLLRRQRLNDAAFFEDDYAPTDTVAWPYPIENFDFTATGAYASYNWELFFHLPMTIALRLVTDQRFEDALPWFHAVFNPTEHADPTEPFPDRVWKLGPLYDEGVPDAPEGFLALLAYTGTDPTIIARKTAVELQIADWRANPFEPHRIARLRLGAYQRFVVQRYIEALIGWGDKLFRQETMESLNEAAQYYALALQLLPPRPTKVAKEAPPPSSFSDLDGAALDAFSNALVKIQTLLPETALETVSDDDGMPSVGSSFAFCIPPNPKVLELWDLVEGRLFKLRHCMNIDGLVRKLPLFEPPIDPGLLVRAAKLGLDLSSVLAEASAPIPVRRFRVLLQKAQEFCSEVKSLGASLLASLEKRDAEELARTRARHERDILQLTREVRKRQVAEAQESLEALKRSRAIAEKRLQHYSTILRIIPQESQQHASMAEAGTFQVLSQAVSSVGSFLALIPQMHATVGPPTVEVGGQMLHNYAQGWASLYGALGAAAQLDAVQAGNQAMLLRRAEEWKLQEELAAKEMEQIDRQIAAQEIRVAIAEQERLIHDRQLDNALEAEDFLKDKHTKRELYDWMVNKTAAVYFQSYNLAYGLALQAQSAYRFERDLEPTTTFIKFGSWDNLKHGLLSGELLSLDLRRMEEAFLRADVRDLELTSHISLGQLSPTELVALRETGTCEMSIPERFFDIDTPGHYLRRIRSVALTIPSVTGPYVAVRCGLELESSQIRTKPSTTAVPIPGQAAVRAMVTSHAREDAGLFDVDPRDDRYLPFEGAGAIANFRLTLPKEVRAFDYRTIQDVVLHMRYTARDGGNVAESPTTFGEKALDAAVASTAVADTPLALLVSVKNELPDAWHRLLHFDATSVEVDVPLLRERFAGAFDLDVTVTILGVRIVAIVTDPSQYDTAASGGEPAHDPLKVELTFPAGTSAVELTLEKDGSIGDQPHDASPSLTASPGLLKLEVLQSHLDTLVPPLVVDNDEPKRLSATYLKDVLLVVTYKVAIPS